MANNEVASTSSEYNKHIKKWELNRLISSSDILLHDNWKTHLFYPQKWESGDMSKERQKEFIAGASLFPALKRTLDGSLGLVFRKQAQLELEPKLAYLEYNCDGNKKALQQLVQDALAECLLQGHGGFLCDFAAMDEVTSKAQDEALNKFATIHLYQAEDIINVYTQKVGSLVVVQQIVLKEVYQKRISQFEVEQAEQYRVLVLDEDGYRQEIWRPDDEAEYPVEIYEPRGADGQRLDYIPFSFFGAESNDYKVDASPLYDLGRMNAKHLEYSAMRNESVRQLAPTLFAFPGDSFDYEDFIDKNPKGITMGGYNAYFLGQGGSASIVQAESNDASVEEMKHLEELMIKAGALLISPNPSNVSLETTMIQRSTDTSVLGMVTKNVESAINEQLGYVSLFMGEAEESRIDLNMDFFQMPMNAQDRAQWAAEVMSGIVSIDEYRQAMNKAGLLTDGDVEDDREVEMMRAEDLEDGEE